MSKPRNPPRPGKAAPRQSSAARGPARRASDPHMPAPAPIPTIPDQDIGWFHPIFDPEQPQPPYRHPFFVEEDRSPLPVLFDSEGYPVILFEAVVLKRKRRPGWCERTQREFIARLARTPSVIRCAEAVGLSARSAYALLLKPDAEQFAKAWDMAIEFAMNRLHGDSLSRCLDGPEEVKVFRKGRHVRTELRHNDKLAIALLSGQERNIGHYRHGAQRRWRQKREWEAADGAKAAEEQARLDAIADYRRQCEEFIARNSEPRIGPRIRRL